MPARLGDAPHITPKDEALMLDSASRYAGTMPIGALGVPNTDGSWCREARLKVETPWAGLRTGAGCSRGRGEGPPRGYCGGVHVAPRLTQSKGLHHWNGFDEPAARRKAQSSSASTRDKSLKVSDDM